MKLALQTLIKHRLESTLCVKHQKQPIVTITDAGISLQCCCTDFQDKSDAYARDVAKEFRDNLAGTLGSKLR